jgi:hypothetical protein
MTGVAEGTALKLLIDLGAACERYQDETLRNLKLKRIQCDELWQFIYAKAKNVPEEMKAPSGSATCGRGLRSMRIRSLCPRGPWAAATGSRPPRSSGISPTV